MRTYLPLFLVLSIFLLGCRTPPPNTPTSMKTEFLLSEDLEVKQIAPGVWLHTTYRVLPEVGRFPSNGLLVETKEGPFLIDTAWGEAPTAQLLDWAKGQFHAEVSGVAVTHAHDDRLGGLPITDARKIPSYGGALTAQRAEASGVTAPKSLFQTETRLTIGGVVIELYFPGAGHAPDNIVVYLPASKILFGGCMIRSAESKALGNLADADRASWPKAVQATVSRFPEVTMVVPGHGAVGGPELLAHTLSLLEP